MVTNNYVHGQVFPNTLPDTMDYWIAVAKEAKSEVGLKFDQNKPRMDLLDPEFLEGMGRVLKYGAESKYEAHNWRKGIQVSRTVAAIYRHLGAINRGEDIDPESGHRHTEHLGVNVQFLDWMLKNKPEFDDRFKQELVPRIGIDY